MKKPCWTKNERRALRIEFASMQEHCMGFRENFFSADRFTILQQARACTARIFQRYRIFDDATLQVDRSMQRENQQESQECSRV